MSTISSIYQGFNSLLSLQPLVTVLKKMIAEGKPGAKKLYQGLIGEMESRPELLQPMNDASLIEKDPEMVETLLSTIFPPSTSSNQGIYAITIPFRPDAVYASPGFQELFLKDGSGKINFSDKHTNVDVSKVSLYLAYDLILKKFYAQPLPVIANSVHPYKDEAGLTKYFELRLNAQFVTVKKINDDFALPQDFTPQQTLDLDELKQVFGGTANVSDLLLLLRCQFAIDASE